MTTSRQHEDESSAGRGRGRLRSAVAWVRDFAVAHPVGLAAILAFALGAYLVSSSFSPNLNEIGTWDEAAYVNSGRRMIEGAWFSVSDNPLVALVYGVLYLPFTRSDFWMIHVTSLGRVVLFLLVWASAYAVARQIARWTHPLVVIGLLLVSSIPLLLFKYPSDPLFVAMAGFSLARLVAYYNSGRRRDLGLASFFLGLSALARNDGLVMLPVFVFLAIIIGWRKVPVWKSALAAAVPFVVVVGGYLLLYGSATGDFRLGTSERTYDNFEAGQMVDLSGEGVLGETLEAKLEARRLFGTPEENGYSIFRAIARNPGAYLARLVKIVGLLPKLLLIAYGQRTAVLLLLLAVRGGLELWRRRDGRLLVVFLLWPTHLASGLAITLFRVGHLRFPFLAVYALAAIGITALIANRASRLERRGWAVAVLVMIVLSVAAGAPAAQMGLVVFGAALLVVFWLSPRPAEDPVAEKRLVAALYLLFLTVGLALHGDFSGPGRRTLGQNPDEQAVAYLQHNFEPGTPIAAGSPGPIYAARMTYIGLTAIDYPLDLPGAEFVEWMRDGGVEAIYIDQSLNPILWDKISGEIGTSLERVFQAGNGDIQVLVFPR